MKHRIHHASSQDRPTRSDGRTAKLVVTGRVPVQFPVPIRHVPVSCSAWLCSNAGDPPPVRFVGPPFLSTQPSPFRAYEKPFEKTNGSTSAQRPRIIALDGAGPRKAVVSWCVHLPASHVGGMASRRAGPGAQARKRRPL